jgi:hypothetical protein
MYVRNQLVALLFLLSFATSAQPGFVANYDEAKLPAYTLPSLLTMPNGQTATTTEQWKTGQRPYLLGLFKQHMFGPMPGWKPRLKTPYKTMPDEPAFGGKAIRKQTRIYLSQSDPHLYIDLLMYLPKTDRPVPVFVGYNFNGNYTTTVDPAVALTANWVATPNNAPIKDHRALEAYRGSDAKSWPYEALIDRGYGVVTAYYGDIEPDDNQWWKTGIRYHLADSLRLKPTQWCAMGAWAWGLSRIADYLETDPAIDSKRMIAIGHSRLGKAALWAGANDERFAAVISNESGEGGAALARRVYGETLGRITTAFPQWFLPTYARYADRLDKLPVDQHMLLALVAPRPLYVASAEGDQWSDPRGEFLGALAAEPAWTLFGKTGLGTTTMPPLDTPVGQTIGYHDRTGVHSITRYDWTQYMNFADKLLSAH